eukprot:Sspe_Gene.101458::Locus_76048_Transcript_1_1_Confidence_1.000_Length_567::g.101458::m.101458
MRWSGGGAVGKRGGRGPLLHLQEAVKRWGVGGGGVGSAKFSIEAKALYAALHGTVLKGGGESEAEGGREEGREGDYLVLNGSTCKSPVTRIGGRGRTAAPFEATALSPDLHTL